MTFTAPDGGTLSGRAEAAVSVRENACAEVTFAYRVRWHRLGADDNDPYRVFHGVSGLAAGIEVEYRAVLRDASTDLPRGARPASAADPYTRFHA